MICGNSYSSSSSESDEDVPIARLKPPRRREIDDSSGDEDDIPLSVIGKKAMQSILPSQSSHDEDNNKDEDQEKEEEEGGELSDMEEPWGGVVGEDILPPNSSWFGMVAKLLNALIHQQDPGYGGVTTVRTNGVVGITPRLSDMPLGGKDIRGCKNMPPEWRKLYMGNVEKKTLAAAEKSRHKERMSISLDEKEKDAKELYQREKEAIRTKRYKGAIPTESVDVSNSPAGDLSTLSSLKPLSLKPASIFASGKYFIIVFLYLFGCNNLISLFVQSSEGVINPKSLCS